MRLPAKFGRYLLTDKIATGGMAEIFKAKLIGVEGFEKPVAIKRILPFWSERDDFVSMLVDEAKILVHLNHQNIVQVFELGCEEQSYFIAMEYVEGVDLRHVMRRIRALQRELLPEFGVYIMAQTLRGLDYAHRRSLSSMGPLRIIHRDISPQNILLSYDGEVKITDFGIAKALIQSHETQTGVLKGKYAYMSPEQACGRPLDSRSDLFACGVVLYELLLGTRLFTGKSDVEILDKVRSARIPWPESEIWELFPGLKETLAKSLSLNPDDRFATAEEFRLALESAVPAASLSNDLLSQFLYQVMDEDIRKHRIREIESQNHTRSFLRKTKVEPTGEDQKTPSTSQLSETEKDISPHFSVVASSTIFVGALRRWKLGLLLASIVIIIGGWGWYQARTTQEFSKITQEKSNWEGLDFTIPESTVQNLKSSAALSFSPSPSPQPSPLPQTSFLKLRVEPKTAMLVATYPGFIRRSQGDLLLENIPLGTKVRVSAQLKDHESQNKVFEISKESFNSEYLFRLKEKDPQFGRISINAVPWGIVEMRGFISGNETPISRGNIPEGSYSVSVHYPATGKKVRTTAVIRGGKTTRCHADFEGGGRMFCQ